jgi:hypothetical protein
MARGSTTRMMVPSAWYKCFDPYNLRCTIITPSHIGSAAYSLILLLQSVLSLVSYRNAHSLLPGFNTRYRINCSFGRVSDCRTPVAVNRCYQVHG